MSSRRSRPITNPLLAAALKYASLGWHVFPLHTAISGGSCSCERAKGCKSPGKHPRTKNGVKDATTDAAKIREWWLRQPDSNIGIATGIISGIVVLDIDHKNDGMTKLRQIEALHGDLPVTVTGRTGNGHRQVAVQGLDLA